MLKSANAGLIALALSIIVSGFLLSNLQVKSKAYERSVEVKGLAEREVEADLGVWPIQVTLASNDLAELKRRLDEQKSWYLNSLQIKVLTLQNLVLDLSIFKMDRPISTVVMTMRVIDISLRWSSRPEPVILKSFKPL